MIQFMLMLLGFTFSNDNVSTNVHNQNSYTAIAYSASEQSMDDGGPVRGENEQTPPPRKK